MQLLVSVRSGAEARIALAGGADIIDAKEPSRGSLGAVLPGVLHQICGAVPHDLPISVALGDVGTVDEVLEKVSTVSQSRHRATYLKLGFAGTSEPDIVHCLLRAAIGSVAGRSIGIVAVAYADAASARCLPPEVLCGIAADAAVAGMLVDTYQKGESHLLTWLDPSRLGALLAQARAARLLTAVAGGLGVQHLPTIRQTGPDIVGFRGALCIGGRAGTLSEERVRYVKWQLGTWDSGFVHPAFGCLADAGETPGGSAILGRPNELTH
jgi:(5-formylfuran-3-yl)methyl phosphate synthase